MADHETIRAALAASLGVLKGVQAHPYVLGDPTPPTIYVFPGDTEYDKAAARGLDRVEYTVRALSGAVGDIAAQRTLDKFLANSGPSSVKAALEKDRTLGGVVQTLRVTRHTGYRALANPAKPTPYLTVEWTVEMHVAGNE